MIKVLVLGRNGQLGNAFERLHKGDSWQFLNRQDVDVSQVENLESFLMDLDFNILINCTAYTAVDQAEDEKDLAEVVNIKAVGIMAEVCAKKDAVLFHYSTDYVFGSREAKPFREDIPTSPECVYGRTKLDGELAILKSGCKHFIIRTSWLYGATGHNFLNTMLRLGSDRDQLSVVYDQVGTPTFVDDLADATLQIISQDAEGLKSGIYHFSNEGVASWYDFALAIFEKAGNEVKVSPVTSEAFPTKAKRPNYSVLDKRKIKNEFGLVIAPWRDGLDRCLAQKKN